VENIMGGGLTGGFTSPIQQGGPIARMYEGLRPPTKAADAVGTRAPDFVKGVTGQDQGRLSKFLYGRAGDEASKGAIGAGGEFGLGKAFGKGIPAVFAGSTIATMAVQAAMGDVGERETGESLEAFNARRKSTVGSYLDYYFRRANKFRIAPENMDAAAAKFVADNTKEYVSHGGRIGYQTGGITMANTLAENIRRNQAQQQAVGGMFEAARSRLPGYVAPTTPEQKATVAATNLIDSMSPGAYIPERDQTMPVPPKNGFMDDTLSKIPVDEGFISRPVERDEGPGMGPGDKLEKAQYYTGPDYGPGQGMAYTAQAPQRGFKFVYDQQGQRYEVPIEGYEGPIGNPIKLLDAANLNQGGRVGLRFGTPEEGIKSLDAGAPDITYEGNEGPQAPQEEQQMADALLREEYDKYVFDLLEIRPEATPMSFEEFRQMVIAEGKMSGGQPLPEDPTKPINPFAPKPTGPVLPDKMMAAQGGRIGQLYGTGPAGLPGIPRMAPDGLEYDMRENGGFQGLGAKEGKDDVNAKLAKNEFVFTADAVRGAGNGDIELGAQKMYDTMKKLEGRVA